MNQTDFWNRYLEVYDVLNRHDAYVSYMDEIPRRLHITPGMKILDAGSGTGNLSIRMKAKGADVVSLDFSPTALRIHRMKDPTAVQIEASLTDPLPLGNGSMDAVVCASVLFALPLQSTDTVLKEFARALKPGGQLVVTSSVKGLSRLKFAYEHLRDRFKKQPFFSFVRETLTSLWPMVQMLYYCLRIYGLRRQGAYRQFSKEELLETVERGGFVNLRYSTTFMGRFHMVEATTPVTCAEAKPSTVDAGLSKVSVGI